MSRKVSRRLGVGLTFAIVGAVAVSPLAGCESGGLGGLMGSSSAMDMLSPMVKDAANSYVSNLSSLSSSLGNLEDLQGVMDFVKQIEPTVNELTSAYRTLSGTTGEERTNLMDAFGPKIEAANTAFLSQSDNVRSNVMWDQVLSPVLDQIALFR